MWICNIFLKIFKTVGMSRAMYTFIEFHLWIMLTLYTKMELYLFPQVLKYFLKYIYRLQKKWGWFTWLNAPKELSLKALGNHWVYPQLSWKVFMTKSSDWRISARNSITSNSLLQQIVTLSNINKNWGGSWFPELEMPGFQKINLILKWNFKYFKTQEA